MSKKTIWYSVKTTGKDPKNPFLKLNKVNQLIVKDRLEHYMVLGKKYPVNYDTQDITLGRQERQNGVTNTPKSLTEGLLAKLQNSYGVNDFSLKTSKQMTALSKIMNLLDPSEPIIEFAEIGSQNTANGIFGELFEVKK
jgi:hypothetical protein